MFLKWWRNYKDTRNANDWLREENSTMNALLPIMANRPPTKDDATNHYKVWIYSIKNCLCRQHNCQRTNIATMISEEPYEVYVYWNDKWIKFEKAKE